MKLTRYSLFAQKVQLDRVTKQPTQRAIGETLLDHFLGDKPLYLAQNNDFVTQEEIDLNAPEGTELILVDREDLIYGSPEAKAELKKVLPIDYLAGAYASVFKGGCQPLKSQRPLKVAVVDFSDNYQSGNANIPAELSRQFVHDSCGAIDAGLLEHLSDRKNAIQFRLGLKGDRPTFAKGMLNPIDLQQLFPADPAPDLILSLDSFKGNKPAPGLYEYAPDDLFLGIKNDSLRTDSSINEVISIYPESAPDVLPIIHTQAQILAANSREIVTMAAQAVNDYYLDTNDEASEVRQDEFNTAKLIEMALTSGRYNLLNSRQVQDWLEDRINASWKNLSFGDIPELNSHNATALPAWDLKYGEVCAPWLPDGEELIFWRSPIVNRNGIVTAKNNLQVWEQLKELGADPNIIYVNVQTLDRIKAEDADTYQRLLTEYGSEERLENEFQTLMAASQMDFDGDTANVIERSRLPHLYDAVKLNEHPDRKLANFHKSDKNLPVDWSLAQIAEHIRPNYVGVVYSHKKAIELTRAEIELAISEDNQPLMNTLEMEYFEKSRKMLYKDTHSDLRGRTIADIEFTRLVRLPVEIKNPASEFVNSFNEQEIVDRQGQAGFNFVVGKMIQFRNTLQVLTEEITDTKHYEFTSPEGSSKQKLPKKLLDQIREFQKLPLRSLVGKSEEKDKLTEYLAQYQKLSQALRQEIDLSEPVIVHSTNKQFDRNTNTFSKVKTINPHYLMGAAAPKTDAGQRLRLYQKVLDAAITATSQLNQDAVDVFKSANIIHDENSQVLQRELARDKFNSVSGKTKSRAYKDGNLPQPNGMAVPHLIQELCNQNYEVPFRGKEEISNPDLIRSFRDIPVSSTAAAIAQFYLSDDQQIIEKYKEMGRIESLNQGKKTYLDLQLKGDNLKIFALNSQLFTVFKNQAQGAIKFDFKQESALVGEEILGKLDPLTCKQLAAKYPQGLTIDRHQFEELRTTGKIDLVAIHEDRRALTAERRAKLNQLRQAFSNAGIEPTEALAAIAQTTNRARAGYLVAAYPEVLKDHIKNSPVDNLVLDETPALLPILNRLGRGEHNFYVDDDGKLNIGGQPPLEFLRDRTITGDYRVDNRIKAAAHLKPRTVGKGKLVTEAHFYSLRLMEKGKGVIVANLTEAGKQITNGQEASVGENVSLEPVESLPYSLNVMGMECPISSASAGLEAVWAKIAEPTQLEFREFRYNPINPKTGKASFAAVLNHEGKDYYLEGTIPDVDRKGNKIRDNYPDYSIKLDFSRQISPITPVTFGYNLVEKVGDWQIKLGEVTTASAKAAGILHDYTWDIVEKTSAQPLPTPQPRSIIAKLQERLEVPEPDRMFSNAVWDISTQDQRYQTKSRDSIDKSRVALLNDLSSNPLLVTRTQIPTIANDRVELQERYQIAVPAKDVAAVEQFLQGDDKNANIPYQLYNADTNPHPSYQTEYQRGYSVFLVEPSAVTKKARTKTDPLVNRIKKLLDPEVKQPLDTESYQRELQGARIVRPVVGKNLQNLGSWLREAGELMDTPPTLDIDNLHPLPPEIAPIGAEAKARFHARVGTTEDKAHTVFYFGAEYLRDRFITNMGDAPLAVDNSSAKTRTGKIYAAVVPTEDLESYRREHYRHYSYNYDERGEAINKILSTYGATKLEKLPARATIDVAMGFAANKYIGKSLLDRVSRVEMYAEAYGEDANTTKYAPGDVVMVTGNRFNGNTITRSLLKSFFDRQYLPLLKEARRAEATIVFGDGNAVDALTKKYLEDSGYAVLKHPHGYNEAVPKAQASLRQQELRQILTNSALPVATSSSQKELVIPVKKAPKNTAESQPKPALSV